MAAAADPKHVFKPKALFILKNEEYEHDDWGDNTFQRISKELLDKHIAITIDEKEIETVQMAIVFINAAFVTDSQDLIRLLIDNMINRPMMVNLIVYENNHDTKLVSDFFTKYEGTHPADFDFKRNDPESSTKLVLELFNRMYTMFCRDPNSDMNLDNYLGGNLQTFIDLLVTCLNPLHIDFTKIQPPELISEVVAVSYQIDKERDSHFNDDQPLLALFKYQPCHEHGCQTMTNILQILYTHQNFLNPYDFQEDGCIYISEPYTTKDGVPPSSIQTFFVSALETRNTRRKFYSHIFPALVVIEDLQKFVAQGEDPRIVLCSILEQLGPRSLVITAIPNPREVDKKCLGETSQCTHRPPSTIGKPWPVCYAMYSRELEWLPRESFAAMDAVMIQTKNTQKEQESFRIRSSKKPKARPDVG